MNDPPALMVLVVEDDPADVALMEDAFTTLTLPSALHHVPDGALPPPTTP